MSDCPPTILVWLAWPEKCFCVEEGDLAFLLNLAPPDTRLAWAHDEAEFLRMLPEATHVIVWNFKRDWFAHAPRLKALATPAAGKELVPSDPPPGVRVHFGGFHGPFIAESVVGFMLAWCRGFFALRHAPERWPRTWLSQRCSTLAGSRAVIAGFGRIGRAIGAMLEAHGVSVTGLTRHGTFGQGSLENADWLILALPSTTGTDNYLDAALIRRLPARCVVINIGRGNAVDEEALLSALKEGRLAGAYLDVIKREPTFMTLGPVAEGDCGAVPKILAEAEELPNLIVTPHGSAFAPQYMRSCFAELKRDGFFGSGNAEGEGTC